MQEVALQWADLQVGLGVRVLNSMVTRRVHGTSNRGLLTAFYKGDSMVQVIRKWISASGIVYSCGFVFWAVPHFLWLGPFVLGLRDSGPP